MEVVAVWSRGPFIADQRLESARLVMTFCRLGHARPHRISKGHAVKRIGYDVLAFGHPSALKQLRKLDCARRIHFIDLTAPVTLPQQRAFFFQSDGRANVFSIIPEDQPIKRALKPCWDAH